MKEGGKEEREKRERFLGRRRRRGREGGVNVIQLSIVNPITFDPWHGCCILISTPLFEESRGLEGYEIMATWCYARQDNACFPGWPTLKMRLRAQLFYDLLPRRRGDLFNRAPSGKDILHSREKKERRSSR